MGARIQKIRKRIQEADVPNWMRRGPRINPWNRRKAQRRQKQTVPETQATTDFSTPISRIVHNPVYTTIGSAEPSKPDRRQYKWFLNKKIPVERRKK
ncbi:MAG: hypothetical protein V1777_00145 [Candidatus Micrarchaeota archaeon]